MASLCHKGLILHRAIPFHDLNLFRKKAEMYTIVSNAMKTFPFSLQKKSKFLRLSGKPSNLESNRILMKNSSVTMLAGAEGSHGLRVLDSVLS